MRPRASTQKRLDRELHPCSAGERHRQFEQRVLSRRRHMEPSAVWLRSAADSSKRKQVPNPRAAWIIRKDVERLRIMPEELWSQVKSRQAGFADMKTEREKRGLFKTAAGRIRAGPKYLFSSLLRCGCSQWLAPARP